MVAVFNLYVTKVLLLSIIFLCVSYFIFPRTIFSTYLKIDSITYLCNQKKNLLLINFHYVHKKNLAFKRLKFLQNVF